MTFKVNMVILGFNSAGIPGFLLMTVETDEFNYVNNGHYSIARDWSNEQNFDDKMVISENDEMFYDLGFSKMFNDYTYPMVSKA